MATSTRNDTGLESESAKGPATNHVFVMKDAARRLVFRRQDVRLTRAAPLEVSIFAYFCPLFSNMSPIKQYLTTGLRTTVAVTVTLSLSLTLALNADAQSKKSMRTAEAIPLQTPPAWGPKTEPTSASAQDLAAKIDELVETKLKAEKIQPNATTSDEVFLRRIYVDITGRIPTKAEALAFLESKEEGKRAKLIDKLLASDGYVQNYFNFWADVLRVKNGIAPGGQGREGGAAYIQWLKDSLRKNTPYDVMVRQLLTADGATYENGATGFYLRDMGMPLDNMAVTTQVFLGTQMVCAQCHNHPFDKWSQMDYFQMAAHSNGMAATNNLANAADVNRFMAKANIAPGERKEIQKAFSEILFRLRFNHVFAFDRTLKLPTDYQYKDAKPNAAVKPMIPASFSKEGNIVKDGEAPILAYSQWMTSKENPRFTLVVANRLWKKVMGMGVIDPVDDLTDSTVPSNPALMEFLEKSMKDVNYNMKAYLRALFNSKTYQREAHTADVEPGSMYHFPGPLLRRMTAEQVWDSIVAMIKDNPDEPSHATYLDTMQMLTKVEWLDRTILVQTPEDLVEGARKIAAYQKELTAEVQAKSAALKTAKGNDDEAAIRAAKDAAKGQRNKIYAKTDEIVFENGFQNFARRVSSGEKSAVAKETDKDFAEQVAAAVKHYGKVPTMEEALSFVMKRKRDDHQALIKAQREREMKEWDVVAKPRREAYNKFADYREKYVQRSADLRNPAPNGHFLRIYGQSDREIVENGSRDASVMQALTMMNGALFRNLLSPFAVVTQEMNKSKSSADMIDAIYLSTLSRRATEEEKNMLRPVLTGTPEGRGDVLWTILNTRQFLFIQ